VLIVEDDEALTRVALRTLGEDFEVVAATSFRSAQGALANDDFDVLIVDLVLPDGSGLDLLPEGRAPNPELPVVMVTGSLSVESATKALRSQVQEYLAKPFSPAQLLGVARRAAESGRLSRMRTKLLSDRYGGEEVVRDIAETEKAFARALPKIAMAFQPIVRAVDGSVFGYEALLRCAEPSLSTPLRLLAAAEVLGRLDDLGRAVRRSVAVAVQSNRDSVHTLFVNIHPSEVRADLLADTSDPLLMMAERVVLEITERASLEPGPKLDAELARIRELGYRVAVDDLGEGYAGLSSLVHLHPDIVKIDMSLVHDVHRTPLKRDIVAALVDMARRSGISVVAEGIETVADRDTLVQLGCDLLQGYLFAEPGPPFPVPRTTFQRTVASSLAPGRSA
jgi:EAL domain-containing protein (putative c-di-GMP-specific phosphodiesterase class I)/CheY-like chemotaxis protein